MRVKKINAFVVTDLPDDRAVFFLLSGYSDRLIKVYEDAYEELTVEYASSEELAAIKEGMGSMSLEEIFTGKE